MKFLALLTLTFIISTAHAEKMSVETHSALIQKLQSVLDFSEESVSKLNMKIRLADLYAERARLYSMAEEGRGDIKFKKEISQDRLNAITLYTASFKKADTEKKGLILLQMAHLNRLLGRTTKSKGLYDNIIRNNKRYDSGLVAQAHIEAGDYEFNKQNFKKSQSHFEKALQVKNVPRGTYAKYRIAWCQFHMGKTEASIQSLKNILSNSESFKKESGTMDASFQEEASRDLATFLARRDIRDGDIEDVLKYSPDNAKAANLTYLATELDRTGKKRSALKVWAVIGAQNPSSESQLEGQIKITKIQYDLGKKEQTIAELTKAIVLLKNDSCDDQSQCLTFQQQIRKIVTDWGKAEETRPTPELIEAYKAYSNNFDDIEISYWAAQAAQKRKQWVDAFALYKKTSELSYKAIKSDSKKSLNKEIYTMFEGALLGTIDSAEQSQDQNLRSQAYSQYLNLNPVGVKSLDVEYQVAQLALEQKKYAEAVELFKNVALSNKKDTGVKNKAADLALDTLVLLKDDEKIEKLAMEFSQHFSNRKSEFLAIARKSILNQAANTINSTDSKSSLESQYDKLSKTDLSKASVEEKANFEKHKILIAGKTKNIDALIASTSALITTRGIAKKDKNNALKQLAWAYEMKFDFKNAYRVLGQVQPDAGESDEHQLKLGITAELAGLNPTSHYEKYLSKSSNTFKKQNVALSLVRLAPKNRKSKIFAKYKDLLRGNTPMYMTAGLYAYDVTRSNRLRSDLISQKGSQRTFEGQLLERMVQIEKLQKNTSELSKHRLESKNQKVLAKSLQKRIALLNKFEKTTQSIISSKDFTLQFIALSTVAIENNRLAQDIIKLPLPSGLKKKQKEEYKKLVQQQVVPYKNKSKEVSSKINQLWNQKEDSSFDDVLELSVQKNAPGYTVALNEVNTVKRIASRHGYSMDEMAKKWQQRQKLSLKLGKLRSQVKRNPFDSSYLQEIKEIEERLNSGPMVAYLDARLSQLEQKQSSGGKP